MYTINNKGCFTELAAFQMRVTLLLVNLYLQIIHRIEAKQ